VIVPEGDRVDLAVRAPLILTMSDAGVVEDGCVAVSRGIIVSVGDRCPPSAEEIEMPHHMLMPGLVDAHAYTYMLAIGRRGATEDFRPSAEALYWSALLAYTTMLLSGVTTVRDSAHDPSVLERAARRSGMRVIASRIAGPGERPGADWPELTLRAARDPGAAGTAPSGPGTRVALDASDAEIPPGADVVRSLGASVVVSSSLPLEVARELGEAGIGIVVTPSQALRGRWTGGVLRVRSVGVRAALGTGIRPLYALPDLLEEARIAIHLDAMAGFEPDPLPLVESMTSAAGDVLGERVGRIAPGFRADMAALDVRKPHLRFPRGDEPSATILSATRGDFDYVIVGGSVVVEGGRHRWLYLDGIARKLSSVLEAPEPRRRRRTPAPEAARPDRPSRLEPLRAALLPASPLSAAPARWRAPASSPRSLARSDSIALMSDSGSSPMIWASLPTSASLPEAHRTNASSAKAANSPLDMWRECASWGISFPRTRPSLQALLEMSYGESYSEYATNVPARAWARA